MARQLRYFFDYCGGPFWDDQGWVNPEHLPLSPQTRQEIDRLDKWYWQSLNQSYPPDPSPWRQEECDRFNQAERTVFKKLTEELGPDFVLIDKQVLLREDPDLDEYLRNPKAFKRKPKPSS